MAGVEAEHEPLHWIVPVFVWPQEFAEEVQAEPYPEGFDGVDGLAAVHTPLQLYVPVVVVVWPQAFGEEVFEHAWPELAEHAAFTVSVTLRLVVPFAFVQE